MIRSAFSQVSRYALSTLVSGVLLVAFATQSAAAADLAVQLPGDPALASVIAVEQAMLDLTNADRVANGLAPLEFDPDTLTIARQRAASQLGTPALTHYDSNGDLAFVNMLAASRIGYELAGENLARASANDTTVTSNVQQALMKSPLHRKNILEKSFNRVAIGVATDGNGQITFAEVYRN
jgi:uncharacterized protein YkwD